MITKNKYQKNQDKFDKLQLSKHNTSVGNRNPGSKNRVTILNDLDEPDSPLIFNNESIIGSIPDLKSVGVGIGPKVRFTRGPGLYSKRNSATKHKTLVMANNTLS